MIVSPFGTNLSSVVSGFNLSRETQINTELVRQVNGTVTITKLAPTWNVSLTRNGNGTVTIG